MGEVQDVLAANEAFYAAFNDGDAGAMDALWAAEAQVACLHPGWKPLLGRQAVMQSWRGILLGGGAPDSIRCENAVAHVSGDVAWVVCIEALPAGALAATNLFQRERGAWRMIHHHASPLASAPAAPPPGLRN